MYDDLILRLRERAGAFDYDGRPDIACDYEQAADAIVALTKSRWISVTEPPNGIALAVNALQGSYGYGEYLIGYISENEESDSGYSCESEGEILMNVTHWMPLPSTEGLNET